MCVCMLCVCVLTILPIPWGNTGWPVERGTPQALCNKWVARVLDYLLSLQLVFQLLHLETASLFNTLWEAKQAKRWSKECFQDTGQCRKSSDSRARHGISGVVQGSRTEQRLKMQALEPDGLNPKIHDFEQTI